MSSDPRPRDDRGVAQDLARDLADIAAQISFLKGEANAYLTDPEIQPSAAQARERTRSC